MNQFLFQSILEFFFMWKSEKQHTLFGSFYGDIIIVINSFPALSSVIASLCSLSGCFVSLSQTKSSLLQSRFRIQSLSFVLLCPFCSAFFVFSHSFTSPLILPVPHTDCFVRHPCSQRVSNPSNSVVRCSAVDL